MSDNITYNVHLKYLNKIKNKRNKYVQIKEKLK